MTSTLASTLDSTGAAPVARVESRSAVVAADPRAVFALLADPARHPEVDGSGTVRALVDGPDRLALGAAFAMRMKAGMAYTTRNVVVEFEEGRRIAWHHRARHVWRWELVPAPGGTRVTASFDWSAKRAPRLVARAGIPAKAAVNLEKSLAGLVERYGAGA